MKTKAKCAGCKQRFELKQGQHAAVSAGRNVYCCHDCYVAGKDAERDRKRPSKQEDGAWMRNPENVLEADLEILRAKTVVQEGWSEKERRRRESANGVIEGDGIHHTTCRQLFGRDSTEGDAI